MSCDVTHELVRQQRFRHAEGTPRPQPPPELPVQHAEKTRKCSWGAYIATQHEAKSNTGPKNCSTKSKWGWGQFQGLTLGFISYFSIYSFEISISISWADSELSSSLFNSLQLQRMFCTQFLKSVAGRRNEGMDFFSFLRSSVPGYGEVAFVVVVVVVGKQWQKTHFCTM